MEIKDLFKNTDYRTAIKKLPDTFVKSLFIKSMNAGINPLMPLLQVALETGGVPRSHQRSHNSHNWFNITTSSKGKSAKILAPEYVNGKLINKNVNFKIYSSDDAAIDDFIRLIKNNYLNYNKFNFKSLQHKNGGFYASADTNQDKPLYYTKEVVNNALKIVKRFNLDVSSFESLKKTISDLLKQNTQMAIPKQSYTIKKENLTTNMLVTNFKKKYINDTKKNTQPVVNLGTTIVKKKKSNKVTKEILKDHSVSYGKEIALEYINNGVYVTYGTHTVLFINSTSIPMEVFVQNIIREVNNNENWD